MQNASSNGRMLEMWKFRNSEEPLLNYSTITVGLVCQSDIIRIISIIKVMKSVAFTMEVVRIDN